MSKKFCKNGRPYKRLYWNTRQVCIPTTRLLTKPGQRSRYWRKLKGYTINPLPDFITTWPKSPMPVQIIPMTFHGVSK